MAGMRRRLEMVTIDGVTREMEVVVDEGPRRRADGAALARILRYVADRVERYGPNWLTLGIAQQAIDRADRSERECHADGGGWFGWQEPLDLHKVGAPTLAALDAWLMLQDADGGEE